MKNNTCITIVFLFLVVTASYGFAAQGIITINLKDEVEVNSSIVRMKDIAEIHGAAPEILKSINEVEICPAPLPGIQRVIRSGLLKSRLREHNVSMENISFAGEKCSVFSKTAIVTGEKMKDMALDYVRERGKEDKVERQIEVMRIPNDVEVLECDLRLETMSLDYGSMRGLFSIYIGIYNGDKLYRKMPVFLKVKTFEKAVVALRDIKRFDIIEKEDLLLKKVETTGLKEDFIKNPEAPAGKRAKYSINRGKVFFQSMYEDPPLIDRGDMIDIQLRQGNVTITVKGKAKKDGSLDEMIPVRVMMTKKDLVARVIDSNTVSVEK